MKKKTGGEAGRVPYIIHQPMQCIKFSGGSYSSIDITHALDDLRYTDEP